MSDAPIDIAAFLEGHQGGILERAGEEVSRAHLAHYEAAGADTVGARLQALLGLVISSCRSHRLDAALEYAETLAGERHELGYSLAEVQTAINVLEEIIWRTITAEVPTEAQGYALGLVSTVLGAIKDRLACAYVSAVSHHPTHTLRLDYLFGGSEGPASEP